MSEWSSDYWGALAEAEATYPRAKPSRVRVLKEPSRFRAGQAGVKPRECACGVMTVVGVWHRRRPECG